MTKEESGCSRDNQSFDHEKGIEFPHLLIGEMEVENILENLDPGNASEDWSSLIVNPTDE